MGFSHTEFKGSTKVKHDQLLVLKREFEMLTMKDSETVNEYFSRTLAIMNKMKKHGGNVTETEVVEKILRSMPAKYNYVVCSIVQANNVETLSVDELQSSSLLKNKE